MVSTQGLKEKIKTFTTSKTLIVLLILAFLELKENDEFSSNINGPN